MNPKRWIYFFLAISLGVSLGLFYGWVINPVQYFDTTPETLRIDYRTDYAIMIAESFQRDQNIENSIQNLMTLGKIPPLQITSDALSFAEKNNYYPEDIILLQNLNTAIKNQQFGGNQP